MRLFLRGTPLAGRVLNAASGLGWPGKGHRIGGGGGGGRQGGVYGMLTGVLEWCIGGFLIGVHFEVYK
jgi:formylglycine-generating enzyme required for sulfatase activity